MDELLSRIKAVVFLDSAKEDIQRHLVLLSGDGTELQEAVNAIRLHLSRNADICLSIPGTNVKFYRTRPMRNGYTLDAHFYINCSGVVEVCRLILKKVGD